jgi:hypothetical protein
MVFAESRLLTGDSYFHIKLRTSYFQSVEIMHSVQDDRENRGCNGRYFHQDPGKLTGQEKHCPWGKYALPCLPSIAGVSLIKSLVAGTSGKN